MIVQFPVQQVAAVLIYLLVMTGIILLGFAEREDASTPVTSYSSLITITGEPSRTRITHSRDADLSAGDIFNRSFGVLTVAAN